MIYRLHAGVRNDVSGTPFQVYVRAEDGREISALLDQDYKDFPALTKALRGLADGLDDAAERAALK